MHYCKLQVWQRAMEITRIAYTMTKTFPKHEEFGLGSQMRRAAVSVPSNIAEGSQRGSKKDFGHFILIAKASLAELETQVMLAESFEYVSPEKAKEFLKKSDELSRMLYAFHAQLGTAKFARAS
jgi:four helix bundle protein